MISRTKRISFKFVFAKLAILLFTPYLLLSQNFDLNFQHLDASNGLDINTLNTFVYKDKKGFVWISSLDGLYRFDGAYLKHYKVSPDGETGENIQSNFFEDEKGNIWFSTSDAIQVYQRKKNQFQHFRLFKDNVQLDADYRIFDFDSDKNKLWLAIGNSIWNFDIKTKEYTLLIENTNGYRFTRSPTIKDSSQMIFAFPWIAKSGFEIWKEINQHWQLDTINNGIFEKAKISKGIIQNDSTIWLISSNLGLIEYDILKNKERKIYLLNSNKKALLIDGLMFNKEQMILSFKDEGLWLFDFNKKVFIKNWKNNKANPNSIATDNVIALNLDQDNTLWLTHRNLGLDYSTYKTKHFTNPLYRKFLKKHVIKNIFEDHFNRVWVLDINNGIFVFDLNGLLLQHFKSIGKETDFSKAFLSQNNKGQIYLGINNTVFKFDSQKTINGQWDKILEDYNFNQIYSMFHTETNQTYIVTTRGIYLLVETQKEIKIEYPKAFKQYRNFEFRYFFQTDKNTFLASHNGKNVFIYKLQNDHFQISDTLKIESETFDVFYNQKRDFIWLAGRKGLYQIDSSKDFKLILPKEKLEKNCDIYSIIGDQNGYLWLSTNKGVWRFNPDNNQLLKFSQTQSLPSSLFAHGNGMYASDDKIWFDSEDGLIVFNPSEVIFPDPKTQVYIDNFWVNNKEDQRFLLDQIPSFNYTENKLDFKLGITGATKPSNEKIKYRLKNYNSSWSIIDNGAIINFPSLPPNDYTLELIPIDAYNQLGTIQSFPVRIIPPLWQRLWFQISSFIVLILLTVLFVRYYYSRKLAIQKRLLEKQKMINEERDRIAKELHDDIGGGLSSILFLSEDLNSEEKDKTKKERTERITNLSKDALSNMKDIIWALDNQQNTLTDLVQRIKKYANYFLSDHQIKFEFSSQINQKSEKILSSESKRNLLLITKECLHNIVKHAQAETVIIKIKTQDQKFYLLIHDDGKGFDLEQTKSTGFGLHNIKKRCAQLNGQIKINSNPDKGTKIKLILEL